MQTDIRRQATGTSAAARHGSGRLACLAAAALLCACAGGSTSSGPIPGDDLPASTGGAARFLTQSTFGPRTEDVDQLMNIGYTSWIDWQMGLAPSLHRPLTQHIEDNLPPDIYDARVEAWWRNSLNGKDQLRQRVAWALSQIFVISDRADSITNQQDGIAEFYDILVRGAFGSYRELLEDVTRSPQMGAYLSMLQNQKPDPENNIFPDENYAREVMQLFSIGLKELNQDGTPVLDGLGAEIPTYDQEVIKGMAHALTGWNYASAQEWWAWEYDYLPMEPWDEFHDMQDKLVVTGTTLAGGQSAAADLATVLDLLANHQNVGPFLGKQLIQRLVTSNPSPEYVARISAVFADDGTGARGNLGALVKAILLDPEARDADAGDSMPADSFGKVREPLLRLSSVWRAFHASSSSGWINYGYPEYALAQAPLRAPSVFNFYRPDYAPPGELSDLGLVAPELQITTHTNITSVTNEIYYRIYAGYWYAVDSHTMKLNLTKEVNLAEEDPQAFIDQLDLLFLAGEMSSSMRTVLSDYFSSAPDYEDPGETVRDAIYLVLSSPEYAVQR